MKKTCFTLLILLIATLIYCQNTFEQNSTQYCQIKLEKARKIKTTGKVLTFSGISLGIVGYYILSTSTTNGYASDPGTSTLGVLTFIVGGVFVSTGIPLWVVGSVNEKKYDREIKAREGLQASLFIKGPCLGIVLRF